MHVNVECGCGFGYDYIEIFKTMLDENSKEKKWIQRILHLVKTKHENNETYHWSLAVEWNVKKIAKKYQMK